MNCVLGQSRDTGDEDIWRVMSPSLFPSELRELDQLPGSYTVVSSASIFIQTLRDFLSRMLIHSREGGVGPRRERALRDTGIHFALTVPLASHNICIPFFQHHNAFGSLSDVVLGPSECDNLHYRPE